MVTPSAHRDDDDDNDDDCLQCFWEDWGGPLNQTTLPGAANSAARVRSNFFLAPGKLEIVCLP